MQKIGEFIKDNNVSKEDAVNIYMSAIGEVEKLENHEINNDFLELKDIINNEINDKKDNINEILYNINVFCEINEIEKEKNIELNNKLNSYNFLDKDDKEIIINFMLKENNTGELHITSIMDDNSSYIFDNNTSNFRGKLLKTLELLNSKYKKIEDKEEWDTLFSEFKIGLY